MDKLENLDNLQFLVTELVNSIRQNIIEENAIKNETICYLEKDVIKFIKTNGQFCAGHNIRTLKNIIDSLLTIVKEQDKRISALESKNQHLPYQNTLRQ
jgi:hypothetical protein